ncbi:MAG TPA: hypothetical protein VNI20_14290 [Fimbriimonadaceae bacterium]|nr:hypothetical protein [Fimbriimonadaceae bacterium]
MRRSGKVSVTAIIIVAFVVGLAVMALSSGESPSSAASRFMSYLAAGDYKSLTDMSLAEGVPHDELLDEWKYATQVAAPYYRFSYQIKGVRKSTDQMTIVWMEVTRNAGTNGSYPENYELELHKTKDGWKVNVFAMSRKMYPGLPR